jgi:citrate synthase
LITINIMPPLRTAADFRAAGYLPAAETARRLGIKLPTLYAYVSRGLVTAHRPSDSRASFFHPEEVQRLRARPARSARPALSISSAITLLRPDGLFYRGANVIGLSREHSYEQVAEFLWRGSFDARLPWRPDDRALAGASAAQAALPADALPLERLAIAVAAIAPLDPLRFDLSPASIERSGRSLIAAMVGALPRLSPVPARRQVQRVPAATSVAGILAAALSRRRPSLDLITAINAALILLADHELAASTLAARLAAATRAPIYASVSAGLAVLQGPRHGATSLWAEDLLAEIGAGAAPEQAVAEHLRRGEYLYGFGHPLYEDGDPRAEVLLELVLPHAPATRTRAVEALLAFGDQQALPPPSVEFALAALAHSWQLIRGAGQAIFAVGRTAGWIAHALEEHKRRSLYRIRASYSGPQPTE